jgi:hypothetical protein
MRPCLVLLVVFVTLLGLGIRCSPAPPREAQVSGPLGVARFTDSWMKVRGDGRRVGVNDNTQYVVRKSPKGSGGELLFAVKQGFAGELFGKEVYDFPVKNPDYDYYSDDHYAVSLDGKFRVRKASAEEWDAAEKPLHSYHFIQTFENPRVTGEGVKYKDRLYRKTGDSWGTAAALVSPRGTRVAVFSYTSREKPKKPLVPGFGGAEPAHGEVFLDIYDTSTGERAIAARAPYGGDGGGYAPSMLFTASLWVDERYFIMPTEPTLDACYLGTLGEK